MSSAYKKRQKALKRTHRERGQIQSRQHLGLLEKHKDYVLRAKDYQRKKLQLKQLHEKARNRNPDEFYYKMVNSKLKDGRHVISQDAESFTPEQLQLMKTQDEKYVQMKLAVETKKIERLKSCLHNTGLMARTPPNSHTIFVDSAKEVASCVEARGGVAEAAQEEEEGVGQSSSRRKKKSKGAYKELNQRVQRCKELQRVALKMRTQKDLMGKGVRRKMKGDGTHPAIYKWKAERKK